MGWGGGVGTIHGILLHMFCNLHVVGTLNEVKEMKGLDIVRRDWSDIAKDSGKYVDEIF